MSTVLARTVVGPQGQERFAAFSGDRNPMHMDASAARRTQAGAPVVHGVHTLLWALDQLAAQGRLPAMESIRATFLHWVFPSDEVLLYVEPASEDRQSLRVDVAGLPVLAAEIGIGEAASAPVGTPVGLDVQLPRATPCALGMDDLQGRDGQVYVATAEAAAHMFPHLSRHAGAAVVAEIAACSYVVGMEAPGLHSTFARLALTLRRTATEAVPKLDFRVAAADARFRKVRIAVEGSALHGTLQAFLRHPPAQQAGMEHLAQTIAPAEFAGVHALVVGGSRGLGELAAKSIAAGGGRVTVTYATGAADAERLAASIGEATGTPAAILRYDVRDAAATQLASAKGPFTHMLYFATPSIFRPSGSLFSPERLAEFEAFYLGGFYHLCMALHADGARLLTGAAPLAVYYPSSVAVDERPAGMTEYSMAKAAGEHLCRDMNRELPWLRIWTSRLPRLRTDQTAGLMPERDLDPLTVLLPILREMVQADEMLAI